MNKKKSTEDKQKKKNTRKINSIEYDSPATNSTL